MSIINKLEKVLNKESNKINSVLRNNINKVITDYKEIKRTKPKKDELIKKRNNKLVILEKKATIKLGLLNCLKNVIPDKKIKTIKALKETCNKNNIYDKLRRRRKINTTMGLIIQDSVIPINNNTLFTDFENNEDVSLVNAEFRNILSRAHKALWNKGSIGNATIKFLYAYPLPNGREEKEITKEEFEEHSILNFELNDLYKKGDKYYSNFEKPYIVGVKSTKKAEFFTENIEPLEYTSLKIEVENKDSSSDFILIGYKISYSNKKGGLSLPKNKIQELKAYKPISERKYHELTTSSTTNSKICIYESFIDIIGKKELKYMHHNEKNKLEIFNMLKEEGEEIEKAVKNGELLKSLQLLTKKYNNNIIVSFFQKNINIVGENPFMVKHGDYIEMEHIDINNHIGYKGMLYYKEHVAPFEIKKYEVEKQKSIVKKSFKLFNENLKIDDNEYENIKNKLKKMEEKKEDVEKIKIEIEEIEENQIEDRKVKNILGFDTEIYRLDDGTCKLYNITVYGKLYNKIDDKEHKKLKNLKNFLKKLRRTRKINTKDEEEIQKLKEEIKEIEKKLIEEKSFYGENCLNEFIEYLNKISTKKDNKKSRPKEAIEDIYIYGFNNSKFDNLLIYEALYKEDQSTEFIFTSNCIKRIKYNNLTFMDMNLYYTGSLKSVAEAFQIETHKGVFPYDFVNKDNIYYIGEKPEEKYFNKGDYKVFIEEEKNTELFHMRDYTEKYCLLDSKMVYEIAEKHLNENIGFLNNKFYNTQSCSTGAGIAMKMYKQVFLKEILYESPEIITQHEKLRYKGGRTEVFKKEFSDDKKRLYYFDINSSYPSSMTEDMPLQFIKSEKFNNKKLELKEVVKTNGYYAKITYKGKDKFFIPNILTRTTEGDIIASKNVDFSWHWGIELYEAIKNGCEVIIQEVEHYKTKNIFEEYSRFFYNERLKIKKTNISKASFFKLLLNSLYGKFGQRAFTKKEMVNNSEEMYSLIGQNDKIINWENINDKMLVEYESTGDEYQIGKLIRFSSYITALSRSKLSEIMRNIGHEHIYYCDTDSIFTDKKPSKDYIDKNELGKWKEETETPITNAIFLAPKTYYYCCEDGDKDQKAKGISGKELTVENYKMLMTGEIMNVAQENKMFFRSYNGIKICPQIRHLSTVYNKRIWTDNNSESFKNIEEWRNTKLYKKNYDSVIKEIKKNN